MRKGLTQEPTGTVFDEQERQKILRLNPQIKNPNLLRSGEQVELGDSITAQVETPPLHSRQTASDVIVGTADSNPVVVPPASTDDQSATAFDLFPVLAMTSISAKDSVTGSSATVSSDLDVGIAANFSQVWDEYLRTNLHAKLSYITFEPPMNSAATLANSNRFLTTFGLGENTQLSSRFNLGLSFDIEKNLFVRSLSTTTVTVDSVNLPSLGANLTFDVATRRTFRVSLSALYAEKFGATTDAYTVHMGEQFGGLLNVIKKNASDDQYAIGLGAYSRHQNTSATTQTETLYELSLHLFFDSKESK